MPRRKSSATGWWVERWLAAIDDIGWSAPIARGRAYAQGGHVRDLQIEPGHIGARVQGTRPMPHRVDVRIPIFDDAIWNRALAVMAERAAIGGALLIGELAPETSDLFLSLGVDLFFMPGERIAVSCSCADWQKPCKHAAAALLSVAREMERDPFVLFLVRGRGRDDVLAALRAHRTARAVPGATPVDVPAPRSLADELAADLDRFWQSGTWSEAPRIVALENAADGPAALRRLGPPPRELGGSELQRELATAYRTLIDRACGALHPRRPAARAEDGAAEG